MKRLSLVLAGALVATLAVPAVSAEARAHRPVQGIHVDGARHVVAPARIRPGLVHVNNSGDRSIIVVKKKSWGVPTVVTDWNSTTPDGWQRHFVTVDSLRWHRDAYLGLGRGTYYLVDESLKKITAAQVTTVTVSGATWNAPAPSAKSVTVSGSHNRLTAPSSLRTHVWLHFANKTPNDQVVMLYRIGSKTSNARLRSFVANPSAAKFGRLDIRTFDELSYTSGHRSLYTHLVTTRGRYLLLTLTYPVGRASATVRKGQAVALTIG